jgi:hypothetical protein
MDSKHRPEALPQVDPVEHMHKSILLPQEALLEGVQATLEVKGTCKPRRKPPQKVIHKPTRPLEASKMSTAGIIACPARQTWLLENSVSLAASPITPTTYLSLCLYCKASAHCGLRNNHCATWYNAQEPYLQLQLAASVLGLNRSCFPVTLVVLALTVSLYFPLTPFLLELA